MSKVFVSDTNKQPLAPCNSARARQLLNEGKAAVYRRYPFTIILKRAVASPDTGNRRLKIDPGSRTTGIAIVNQDTGEVEFAAELEHRGQQIKSDLESRRAIRRGRRNRKTRYRKPRFNNRTRTLGGLAPSLMSRIYNIVTWVKRLRNLCPIEAISVELVRFDTQSMQNPEISGIEYQQGELFGYEVREYLLEKFNRTCAYCGVTHVPFEVEHIIPRDRGGSNRVSNLTIACHPCNLKKGNQTASEFGFPDVLAQARKPLKDATAVNATRWALYEALKGFGLSVECGTGSRTKFNRIQRNLPKTHWLDAACIGNSTPEKLRVDNIVPLTIKATGYGSRQMCLMNKYGFPRTKPKAKVKESFGFQTGDIVKAVVGKGKFAGTYIGRIAVRSRPSFQLNGFDVHPKYLAVLHQSDGYNYEKGGANSPLA